MIIRIDSDYPQPHPGFAGALDKFFGPGTTRAEAWIEGSSVSAPGLQCPCMPT
jgi:hypothetical protein